MLYLASYYILFVFGLINPYTIGIFRYFFFLGGGTANGIVRKCTSMYSIMETCLNNKFLLQ